MFLYTLYSSKGKREDGYCQKNPEININSTRIYFLSSQRPLCNILEETDVCDWTKHQRN